MSSISRRAFLGTSAGAGLGAAAGKWLPESGDGAVAAQGAPTASGTAAPAADLMLVNGRIHTMDARNTVASTVTIRNGRIAAVGVERAGVPLDRAVLTRYVGRYSFNGGSRTVAGFMGMNQNVTLVDGQLYLNALPLIALSETKFESSGAIAEFFLDPRGAVTRMVLGQTEGEAIYTPRGF